MTPSFDIMEFAVAEKKIDSLIPGKVYEFSYQRKGTDGPVTITRTYYCVSSDKDGYHVLAENNFSDWSDFGGLVTKESKRVFQPEYDMHSMSGKTIRELGIRDTKTFVKNCIKTQTIRDKFGLPPVERKPKEVAKPRKKRK